MLRSLGFADWMLSLLRRLLYAWVRTQVFPQTPAELGLDPARPVCYVLHGRHYSNLLVLIEETRRAGLPLARAPLAAGSLREPRSFFFLSRTPRLAAPVRERYDRRKSLWDDYSPLLVRLVHQAIADPGFDVQLVPVTILWGRAPDKQDSVLKALFSETWRSPGRLRQLFAVLVHGRNTLVRFNAPIALRDLLREESDEARALRKLTRVLRVHFRRQREIAIGPDLSHRNTQVDALIASPPVQAAIAAEAAAKAIAPAAAEARARAFALEIASDYSYGVVRAFELFLTWLWTHLYDGVEVHNFDVVTRIAPGHGIVYVPCHRSHIDYLLLSYVVYRRGLTPPHVAAGANLNIPVVGPLLRRGGAFFLRRSFKGELLYAAVFHEYLHMMISRGFPIEYFIEGGRSRSGRMLVPKAGILGMTVRSFVRGHARPLVFVPVYIGYEKLIEGRTFVGELEGKPKQGESLWQLLGSVRQIKREFGKVHVNFGQPLALGEFLDRARPGWAAEAPDPRADWLRGATRNAAAELAQRINEAAVVNPINLVALALLATPKHTADEHTLHRQIRHCQAILVEAPYSTCVVPCTASAEEIVAYAGRLGMIERVAHPLGDLIRVPEEQSALLAYFRNNVLHLFALPALIARLLFHNRRLDVRRAAEAVAGIYGLLRAELFLRLTPEALPDAMEAAVGVLVARGLVRRSADTGRLLAPEPNSQEFAELGLLGESIRPMLERHFLTLALLQRHGSGRLTRLALEESSHLLAQRLSLLYEFNTPEFSEKGQFANVVAHLVETGLLHEDEAGLLHFDERITTPDAHAELVLPAEVRRAIRRMAGEGAGEPAAD